MLVHLIDVTDMPSHNCPNTVTKQKKKWMKIWALFYHIRYAWWVSKQKIQMLIIIKCILLCRYVKTWMYTHHFFARYTIYDFCHPCLQYVIFWMARLVKSNKKKIHGHSMGSVFESQSLHSASNIGHSLVYARILLFILKEKKYKRLQRSERRKSLWTKQLTPSEILISRSGNSSNVDAVSLERTADTRYAISTIVFLGDLSLIVLDGVVSSGLMWCNHEK